MEELLYRYPAFTLRTADDFFGCPGKSASLKRVHRLQAAGRVVGVLRGVYASVPPGVDPTTFQPDPYLVLRALRPDCVFCGHSALELHGISHQLWNRVTAYSKEKAVTYSTRSAVLNLVKHPSWLMPDAIVEVDRSATPLRVTCPELTLIEGFRFPARVGGIEELVKSADGFRRLNLDLLGWILERFDIRKLYAAIGWFLTRDISRWQPTADFMDRLRDRRPVSPQYLERNSTGGVLDGKWNLIIPRDLVRQEEMEMEA